MRTLVKYFGVAVGPYAR